MEMLNAYLKDLLFLHDCVILPGFGGFVANYSAAQKTDNDYFSPPRKTIAFNPQLRHNDGLLANTVVTIENIKYDAAVKQIELFVSKIQKELEATGNYEIPAVGLFKKGREERILFVPNATTNFLVSPLGMQTFHIMPLTVKKSAETMQRTKKHFIAMPLLRRALVAGVSGFALISLILNQGKVENLTLSSIAPTTLQEEVATEEINNTVTPNLTTATPKFAANTILETTPKAETEKAPTPIVKKYHVMVGCFTMKENAALQKSRLEDQNIEARVFPYSNSLTGVSAGSFESFKKAEVLMNELRNNGKAPYAWVLKRTLK